MLNIFLFINYNAFLMQETSLHYDKWFANNIWSCNWNCKETVEGEVISFKSQQQQTQVRLKRGKIKIYFLLILYLSLLWFYPLLCLAKKLVVCIKANVSSHILFVCFLVFLMLILNVENAWLLISVNGMEHSHQGSQKKIAFSNSKTYFINFNNSIYNFSHIKVSIFVPFHL